MTPTSNLSTPLLARKSAAVAQLSLPICVACAVELLVLNLTVTAVSLSPVRNTVTVALLPSRNGPWDDGAGSIRCVTMCNDV